MQIVAQQQGIFLEELSKREVARRQELETYVIENLKTFVQVGMALQEINKSRLYRSTHGDFESYCLDIFEISRPRAYQLIDAAQVVTNLSTNGRQIELPANERQVRPLLPYKDDPKKLSSIWEKAVKTAPEKKITAKHVQATIFDFTGDRIKKALRRSRQQSKENGEMISEVFDSAFDAFLKAIEMERNKKYKETDREVIVRRLDAIRSILAEDGRFIHEPDFTGGHHNANKLEQAGFRLFRIDESRMAIKERGGGGWPNHSGPYKTKKELKAAFAELMQDSRNLGG